MFKECGTKYKLIINNVDYFYNKYFIEKPCSKNYVCKINLQTVLVQTKYIHQMS